MLFSVLFPILILAYFVEVYPEGLFLHVFFFTKSSFAARSFKVQKQVAKVWQYSDFLGFIRNYILSTFPPGSYSQDFRSGEIESTNELQLMYTETYPGAYLQRNSYFETFPFGECFWGHILYETYCSSREADTENCNSVKVIYRSFLQGEFLIFLSSILKAYEVLYAWHSQ